MIKIEKIGEAKLDKSRSKYILNTDNSPALGTNAYQSGYELDSLVKTVSFKKPKGEYYLHALVVDNVGSTQELVSQKVTTNGVFFFFFCLFVSITQEAFSLLNWIRVDTNLKHGKHKAEASVQLIMVVTQQESLTYDLRQHCTLLLESQHILHLVVLMEVVLVVKM